MLSDDGPFSGFDRCCEQWGAAHPGAPVPCGELFADWLANWTGAVVIGGPAGEAPTVVAVPDAD